MKMIGEQAINILKLIVRYNNPWKHNVLLSYVLQCITVVVRYIVKKKKILKYSKVKIQTIKIHKY